MVAELAALRAELQRLRAENARLANLLRLTPQEQRPPGPEQQAATHPSEVTQASSPQAKIDLFRSLFRARDDVYAVRWQNDRTGKAGWMPAVEGGLRKGARRDEVRRLPLTSETIASHLAGDIHIGFYPLVDGDRTHWLAADFDGAAAMLDALAYLKAARVNAIPAALATRRPRCTTTSTNSCR